MKSSRELDLELVKAAQAGDTLAFETLIKRYKARLTRYLTTFLHDSVESEDAVQETFIKAYLALHSFRGDSSFSTWLFQIGINTAKRNLAYYKRRIPKLADPLHHIGHSQQQSGADIDIETPEATLENKQMLSLLDAALDELPEGQRTALILRELEGLSYEEIAEQMHSPVGTVRSRIFRARDTVAEALRRGMLKAGPHGPSVSDEDGEEAQEKTPST
jgi:RNA polymerase sigma-70 factor (ECF subfamily)